MSRDPRAEAALSADRRQRLQEFLTDLDRTPLELIEALRAAREQLVEDPALARDLAHAELAFLGSQVRGRRHGAELAAEFEATRRAAQEVRLRDLQASPPTSPVALFDLAELRAEVELDEDARRLAVIDGELERRLAALRGVDDALREEARERYAALASDEEELDLDGRIALLRETGRLLGELGRRLGDQELRKLGRRVGRAVCDRILARRLEHTLTRRGAALLENTSLLLLLVVFVLLAFESTAELSPAATERLLMLDASICVFFIVEFSFKLALAPARLSWFLRNALTDLVPAVPAALWFAVPAAGAQETVALRALRLLRITWFARYVQALRPVLRLFRLLLFMAKGLDALVARFRPLLNRNFVFFEEAVVRHRRRPAEADDRALAFRALRREHVLVADLEPEAARRVLAERAAALAVRFRELPASAIEARAVARATVARDVPVEHAIEDLNALQPEDIGALLPHHDIVAIDRVVRIVNAPLISSLPIVRWFRSPSLPETPEERIADLGHRVAGVLERWRARALWFADLHGIVTGPQVLDRVATALVKTSFRPARNLILFGLFFVLVRLLVGPGTAVGQFLSKFVATPVLVLGSVCAVVLAIGFWLKRLAGEAADQFKLTAEASFIGLLELVKRRSQDEDLEFLARRVFRQDMEAWEAAAVIGEYLHAVRTGHLRAPLRAPVGLEDELFRVALLYLHFLDGAVLHESDVKANEQLLANLSLENIRTVYLRHGKRERRRLRKLSLHGGSLLGGPYLWFRFITESIAVETAKRVTDYNRHCLSRRQREVASPERRQAFAAWLRKRRRREEGRLERVDQPEQIPHFSTTEFNALDFLSVDPIREAHVERVFGRAVLQLVRRERQALIREVFGTRPLHELPRTERMFNFHVFYSRHLSDGRVFLSPLYVGWLVVRTIRAWVRNTIEIVREILAPQQALRNRESGRAPFAVALRKIHRMKAPALVEAMRLRAAFDPAYSGAPPSWSAERGFDDVSELERDMEFLELRERDREELLEIAARNRRRVEELHMLIREHGARFRDPDPEVVRCGERAITVAYMTDRDDLRTLLRAEQWFDGELLRMEAAETRLPAHTLRRIAAACARGFRRHPVDVWLRERMSSRQVSRRGRRNFKRAWHDGDRELRAHVQVWTALPAGASPAEVALERAQRIYLARDEVSRELAALRTIQTLSVLDVRNYKRLVFALGAYAEEGESPALAEALP